MKKIVSITIASVAAILSCLSCTSTDDQIQNISVDTSTNGNPSFAININKEIHLSDSVLVGNISKVYYYNQRVYILDKSSKSLLCYKNTGDLLFRICSVGRANEEYTGISNAYLQEKEDKLTIIASEKKILEYSAATGDLLGVSSIDAQTIMFTDGAELESGQMALGIVGPHHNMAICSSDTTIYQIPFYMARDFAFMEKAFTRDGEKTLFIHGMSNNIYSIEPDTAMVKYVVDFKGLEISDSEYENSTPAQIQEIYSSRTVATRMDNLVTSGNWISFSYWLMHPNIEQETCYVLYNKKTGKAININDHRLFPIRGSADNMFISVVDNPARENPTIVLWKP